MISRCSSSPRLRSFSGRLRTTGGLTVVLTLLLSALAAIQPATAHPSHVDGASVADIATRDQLIFEQEALLNTYRCLFDVDTTIVPGGCVDGKPALPAQEPAPFEGTPTVEAVTARDHLVGEQESLLNVYRCLFDVDTQIVPGGCVDGKPANPIMHETGESAVVAMSQETIECPPPMRPGQLCLVDPQIATGPVSDPSAPPKVPTGFTPGTTGPGFTVNEHGRVVLDRVPTLKEVRDLYVSSGLDTELAERWTRDTHPVSSLTDPERKYEIPLTPPFDVGEERLLNWAQKCVSAYEDVGYPQVVRGGFGGDNALAFVIAVCADSVQQSGKWNVVVEYFGVDPECIYDHLIEFLPERAAMSMRGRQEIRPRSGVDAWWGNHCQMRVSHPLHEKDVVLGPFGGVDNWTEELADEIEATIAATWPLTRGTSCGTPIAWRYEINDGQYFGVINLPWFVSSSFEEINQGASCWFIDATEEDFVNFDHYYGDLDRKFPFTTDQLDALGIDWEYKDRDPYYAANLKNWVTVLEVSMRLWAKPSQDYDTGSLRFFGAAQFVG